MFGVTCTGNIVFFLPVCMLLNNVKPCKIGAKEKKKGTEREEKKRVVEDEEE